MNLNTDTLLRLSLIVLRTVFWSGGLTKSHVACQTHPCLSKSICVIGIATAYLFY